MDRTEGRNAARRAVTAWLSHLGESQAWLHRKAQVDPGTLNEFLNGNRWPSVATRGKIEKALGWSAGTITDIADGASPPNPGEESVSVDTDAGDSLLYRAPEGVDSQTWESIKADAREYIEWQIQRAARER